MALFCFVLFMNDYINALKQVILYNQSDGPSDTRLL